MSYRGGWDGLPTSSSSPPLQATLPSSPPSSPTPYERSTSVLASDPFSASAKSLSIGPPTRHRWSRAATAPGRGVREVPSGSLNVLPTIETSAPHVLGEFFESQSDASMSSMDELGSSFEVPTPFATTSTIPARRAFERTESASTDPLSAAGRTDSFSHTAQRLRFSDASPQKGSASTASAAPSPAAATEHAPDPVFSTPKPAKLQWEPLVNRIFDEARPRPALLLGGYGLTSVPSVVGDLRHYVAIDPRRADARTSSLIPANDDHVQLYLWDNALTRLPSALFQVTNLGVLSLRKNQLTHLPAAIGDLRHLRELNVGGNALTYLPAEIQQLQLHTFTYVPNPFLPIPPDATLDVRPLYGTAPQRMRPPPAPRWARAHTDAGIVQRTAASSDKVPLMARTLGSLERGAMPSLADLCVQRLLSDDPLLIEQYETGCLRALQHTLTASTVAKIEAARRSATASWGTRADVRGPMRPMRWYEDAPLDTPAPSALDVDTALEQLDDASDNVWFQRCPGVHERITSASDATNTDWPTRTAGPLFVRSAETRMEWVSHVAGVRVAKQAIEMAGATVQGTPAASSGCLPILWRGCSPGCLRFLTAQHGVHQ